MTVGEYRAIVRRTMQALQVESERIAQAIVLSGLNLVKDRSIRNGIFVDSKEGNYTDYSVNKVLTVRFIGSELNQAGRDFIAKNRLATWQDFKIAQGLPAGHVNLSYTNRMWTSLAIINVKKEGYKIIFTIGTMDDEVKEYIADLVKRYGNFAKPTLSESFELNKDFVQELIDFLKYHL